MFLLRNPSLMLTSSTMIMSTLMAISSPGWLFLWAAMELNMLSFIPIMMNTKNNQETEGSVKYFLAQAFGSALLLLSSMLLWALHNPLTSYTMTMLSLSLMLKLGSFPGHMWYPSVMSSISWISCLILSTWQKLAPLTILAFFVIQKSSTFIMVASAMNAILGGLLGMNQNNLRTIMAYSSIGHLGWIISLLMIFKPTTSMMYFLIYTLIITPVFLMLWYYNTFSSKQLNKIKITNITMFTTMMIMLMSLGGLPPLTGFMPKLMTISMLMEKNIMLSIILIIGSIMNLFFYLNIIISSLVNQNRIKVLWSFLPYSFNTLILASTSMLMVGYIPFIIIYAMIVLNKP